MKTTITEQQAVQKATYKLRKSWEDAGQRDLIIEDIEGLKSEIFNEIRCVFPLLLIYISLLEKEQYKHDPMAAYLSGKEHKAIGDACMESFWSYLREVELAPEVQKLAYDIQKYYDMIAGLLGDKFGLLRELTELYRQVYGGINYHIFKFFEMGHNSII